MSSMSVTSAAMGERSDRVRVTCANSGFPLRVSTTAVTPSCRPTLRLSRWATSWVRTTRDDWPMRESTVRSTLRSSDWASSTMTKASCSERPRMWVSGRTSRMSRSAISSMTLGRQRLRVCRRRLVPRGSFFRFLNRGGTPVLAHQLHTGA